MWTQLQTVEKELIKERSKVQSLEKERKVVFPTLQAEISNQKEALNLVEANAKQDQESIKQEHATQLLVVGRQRDKALALAAHL